MKPARMLAIDDNAALLDNLREILEDAGYEVTCATTGAEALRAASRGFDVATVDLRLPDMDGAALAQRLKEIAPDSEVVLMTGFATMETAIGAVRAGAFAYLVKPCGAAELLLTVEQALRQVRLREEKRELARRAQVAEKLAAVGTLTAGLSHEIRNPLNSAGLQLAVLERGLRKLPAEAQPSLLEPLRLVRDEIRRLERLLAEFLLFARPRELILQRLDLAALLRDVAGFLRGDAERRGVALTVLAEGELLVLGEAERLRQMLINLILNGLEATPAQGRIEVSLQRQATGLLIAIDDSGPGVPPDVREHLFEPFFTTKPTGTGLGLPIVNSIVTQHGWTIAVERSPFGGARFAIRVPVLG